MSRDLLDINQLEEGFQELQLHSDSQFSEMLKLKSDLAKLESENKSLKLIIEQNTSLRIADLSLGISNQQLICEVQLEILKNAAVVGTLTMEEAKKVQIFTDVLSKCKSGKSEDEVNVSRMTEEELLKAAAYDVRN